ncbi:MAG: metallopeptidase family protein [Acidobacteriota bacterium]
MSHDYHELIDEAYEALEQARFGDALAFGRQAIDTEPGGAPGHYLTGAALVEMRQFEPAVPYLRTALAIDPDYPDARFCLASAHFSTCHFTGARYELRRVLAADPGMADAHYWMGLCQERDGDFAGSDTSFRRAHELDATRFRMPFRLSGEQFRQAIETARQALPPYFLSYLRSIHLIVDDLPASDILFEFDPPMNPEVFGLFIGTELLERSLMESPSPVRDRIYLFRRNIERYSDSFARLAQEICSTLLHEVGHAMGLDDAGLKKMGYE